jgi:hypothetical protein
MKVGVDMLVTAFCSYDSDYTDRSSFFRSHICLMSHKRLVSSPWLHRRSF